MTTHRDFFNGVQVALGQKPRIVARRAMAVVSILESSSGDNGWNNPLAVTQAWPGATPYNYDKNGNPLVWRYKTPEDGERATATLLGGSRWDGVRHAFAHARTRNEVLEQFTLVYASWGAHVDFVHLPFNNWLSIRHRLNHVLQPYRPKDPWD